MTTKAGVMFFVTIANVVSIAIGTATKDVATSIGSVGVGIVMILGLGFSFLIEQKEKEENSEEETAKEEEY